MKLAVYILNAIAIAIAAIIISFLVTLPFLDNNPYI